MHNVLVATPSLSHVRAQGWGGAITDAGIILSNARESIIASRWGYVASMHPGVEYVIISVPENR